VKALKEQAMQHSGCSWSISRSSNATTTSKKLRLKSQAAKEKEKLFLIPLLRPKLSFLSGLFYFVATRNETSLWTYPSDGLHFSNSCLLLIISTAPNSFRKEREDEFTWSYSAAKMLFQHNLYQKLDSHDKRTSFLSLKAPNKSSKVPSQDAAEGRRD
jgi:hypothetical protein